jgi:hypothetical protein
VSDFAFEIICVTTEGPVIALSAALVALRRCERFWHEFFDGATCVSARGNWVHAGFRLLDGRTDAMCKPTLIAWVVVDTPAALTVLIHRTLWQQWCWRLEVLS